MKQLLKLTGAHGVRNRNLLANRISMVIRARAANTDAPADHENGTGEAGAATAIHKAT